MFQAEGTAREKARRWEEPGYKGDWSTSWEGAMEGDGQGVPIPKYCKKPLEEGWGHTDILEHPSIWLDGWQLHSAPATLVSLFPKCPKHILASEPLHSLSSSRNAVIPESSRETSFRSSLQYLSIPERPSLTTRYKTTPHPQSSPSSLLLYLSL